MDKSSYERETFSLENWSCVGILRIVKSSSVRHSYFGLQIKKKQSLHDKHLMNKAPINMEATFDTKQDQCIGKITEAKALVEIAICNWGLGQHS